MRTGEPGGGGQGFAGRLLLAQALVLLAGAVTAWLVASAVGPGLFAGHLEQAGVGPGTGEARHAQEAFGTALLVSVAVALGAAGVLAFAVSWYFSRRVRRSLAPVIAAAGEVAAGRYDARVPDPGLGGEFAALAAAFNALAGRLAAVAGTRRRLLTDLAHELRTPLATIEAHLEAVEDGVRDPDAELFAVLRGSTRRLDRLVADIGSLARAEEEGRLSLRRRAVPAARLVEAAVRASREQYDAAGVALEVAGTCPDRVSVDPDRVGQVLANLLDNALRHTPAGGTVSVAATRVAGGVALSVRDTGEGIAAEHLPRVLDRFYRVEGSGTRGHGGSGIGLSIARALVEAHGGRLAVASDGLGHGTTVTATLPAP